MHHVHHVHHVLGSSGDVETGGLAHLHSSGIVRWEAPINAKAYCHGLDASRWPNDQHTCQMKLALSGSGTEGSSLILMRDASAGQDAWVHARAARPLWHLVHSSLNVTHENTNASSITSGNAVNIVVTLRRNTPVMNRILIAPFVGRFRSRGARMTRRHACPFDPGPLLQCSPP